MSISEPVVPLQTHRATLCWLIVLASSVLVLLANWYLPYKVRFTYAPLNNLALILFLGAVPAALMGFGASLRSPWARWPAIALGVLFSVPVVLFVPLSGLDVILSTAHGGDAAFKQIASLRVGDATYRVFRTNGGAMTDFGVVFRREYDLVPGVRLEEVLMSQYHASDASLALTPSGKVRIQVMPYGTHPGFTQVFSP